jgi:hypothetical protein
LIRNKYFNYKTQHQIKNRVISLLGKICGLNRLAVLDYLKQKDNDLFFHVLQILRNVWKKIEIKDSEDLAEKEACGDELEMKLFNYIDNFEIDENFCSL